jgi:hypothetical protein
VGECRAWRGRYGARLCLDCITLAQVGLVVDVMVYGGGEVQTLPPLWIGRCFSNRVPQNIIRGSVRSGGINT